MNNSSIDQPTPEKQVPFEALAVLLSIMSLGTIIGNSLVLLSICTQASLKRLTYIPIGSLALADLLAGTFAMPAYLIKKSPLDLSEDWEGVVCDVFRFSYFVSGYASIVSLSVISTERLIAIKSPLTYHFVVTSRRLRIALLAVWLDVLVISSLPFYPWEEGGASGCRYRPPNWWSLLVIVTNVFIPFLLIFVCYIYMYKTVRRHVKKIQIQQNNIHLSRHKRETKGTKTVTIVIGLFIVSWFPSCLYYFLRKICPACFPQKFESEGIFNSLMKLLTFAGSFWNPLIYCWRSVEFRSAFLRILTRRSTMVSNSLSENRPSISLGVNMH